MRWDPALYDALAAARLRPAIDLCARIEGEPRRIVDLGAGTGGPTALLRERWPHADIVAVDSSPEMLAALAERLPDVRFVQADAAAWEPDGTVDLVFSNALLHWIGDHLALLERMVDWLAPGGTLAVQVPDNWDAPTHRLAREVAADPRWSDRLGDLFGVRPVHDPIAYFETLEPHGPADVWQTTYHHRLIGPEPVLRWAAGTLLRPILGRLSTEEAEAFRSAYAEALRKAYPVRADGTTVLPYRRLFMTLVRTHDAPREPASR